MDTYTTGQYLFIDGIGPALIADPDPTDGHLSVVTMLGTHYRCPLDRVVTTLTYKQAYDAFYNRLT